MAEQRYAEDRINEQATASQLKRRGILAAAGAVVAGIVAKQAAQPVAASTPMLIANTETGGVTNTAIGPTVIISNETGAYTSSSSVFTGQTVLSGAMCGIQGVTGLRGPAPFRCGVFGDCGTSDSIGVFGNANSGAPSKGVFGRSESNGIGVLGQSKSGIGLQGQTEPGSTAPNTLAIFGLNSSTGANGIGVLGASTNGYGVQGQSTNTIGVFGATNGAGPVAGVYGVSNASYGVIGFTTAAGYSGVTAITGTAGVAALAATSTVSNAYAAYFTGSTVVQGDFVAFGGSKSAAVKDASGQHRLVYCVESPESWFEDFGTGTLINGEASVALDKTFAEIVHTNDYHVFLAEHGGHSGLHTTRKGPTGFMVEADSALAATKGKKATDLTGTFSWRVVAKRRDITGERLATFAMPKIHHPDPSQLPTPPGAPRKP